MYTEEYDDSIYIKHFNKRQNHHFQSFVMEQKWATKEEEESIKMYIGI